MYTFISNTAKLYKIAQTLYWKDSKAKIALTTALSKKEKYRLLQRKLSSQYKYYDFQNA